MQDEEISILRHHPLFSQIEPNVLRGILAGSTPRDVAKGQAIFHRGDPADSFFFIFEGWVKLFRLSPDGEEAVIRIFSAGETMAEAVAFTGRNYPVSGEAVENSRVLAIRSASFMNELNRTPELASSVIASMAQHLHGMVAEVERLKTKTGVQRFCEFLLQRCPVREGPAVVALPYEKVVISARLGITPESLSRILGRLRKIGVEAHQSRVSIEDVSALVDVCQGEAEIGCEPAIPGKKNAG